MFKLIDEIDPRIGLPLEIKKVPYSSSKITQISGWGCDYNEDVTVPMENSCVSNAMNTLVVNVQTKTECRKVYPYMSKNSPQFCANGKENQKTSWVITLKN